MTALNRSQRAALFLALLGLLGAAALLLMPFSVGGADQASVQCASPVSGGVMGGDIAELNARGVCGPAGSARETSAAVLAGLSLLGGLVGVLLFLDRSGDRSARRTEATAPVDDPTEDRDPAGGSDPPVGTHLTDR